MSETTPRRTVLTKERDELAEQSRQLQVRIEDMEIHNRRLRSELDKTRAELELVTAERNRAVDRLQRAGLI